MVNPRHAAYQNPDDLEREALLAQMERLGAPSTSPTTSSSTTTTTADAPTLTAPADVLPTDPVPTLDQPAPTSSAGQSDQDYVMGLLSGKQYGPDALASIEPQLRERGIELQKDSGGRVRGRIKLANGDIVDLPGAGEGNDWWSNPRAGGFGWTNRGSDTDAGGWSFGGGGRSAGLSSAAPAGGSSYQGIQSLAPTDSDFFQKLIAEGQRQLGGPSALDRDELLRQLGIGA